MVASVPMTTISPFLLRAAAALAPEFTEAERAVYRRGRNAHVHSMPRGADPEDYHAATALECLFGWLYLHGRRERLNQLFALAFPAGAETAETGEAEARGSKRA